MGRPRKYTRKTLERALDAWCRQITRTVTLTEPVDSGRRDRYGHVIYKTREIVSDSGEPVRVRQFVIPPTVGGLCEYLGIHRSTWAEYCDAKKHPELAEATAWAKDAMQRYLEGELLLREGKNLSGVIFSLQNNYGYGVRDGTASSAGSQEDDPITKSLKEAAHALAEANEDSAMAVHGKAGADL